MSNQQPDEKLAETIEASSDQEGDSRTKRLRKSGGRYLLKSVHAMGGLGRVWVAWDTELSRQVAIKELRPEKTNNKRIELAQRQRLHSLQGSGLIMLVS